MAVRSIQEDATTHDDGNHGIDDGTEAVAADTSEKKGDPDKRFRINPDAKPFVPNPVTLTANKNHYYATENSRNMNGATGMNGAMPPYWVPQPQQNHHMNHHDNVVVPGLSGKPSKKHIAFNIVSNVLDDEVPEDTSKEKNRSSLNHSDVYSEADSSWQTSVSNFTLPLGGTDSNFTLPLGGGDSNFSLPLGGGDSNFTLPPGVDKNYAKESMNQSMNKKTLHEIWSPNPSPSEEIISKYQTQQQLLDSPSDPPETTFEQLQNGGGSVPTSTDMTTEFVHNYDELVKRSNEEVNNQNMNYYYQDMQSAMYNQYDNNPQYENNPHYDNNTQYENNTEHTEYADQQYQTMFMHENLSNDANFNQNDYYDYGQYFDGYQNGGNTRYHGPKKLKQLKSPRLNYDMKMSYVEELGISLDECNDQLKHLEMDFSKADVCLMQEFRLPRSPGSDNPSIRYPQNASRVDKLVIEQQREHQKVESLIGRIERHRFTTMHSNVSVALDTWLSCIKDLRNIRKNELANIRESSHFRNGKSALPKSHMQGDICKMITCVNGLTKHTRSARTIVWCALQMIYASLPNGSPSDD